jgi:predicted DNA-binding transcriptional regulator AlpA
MIGGSTVTYKVGELPIQWLIELDEYYLFHKKSELLKDLLTLEEALALIVFGVSKDCLEIHLCHAGVFEEDAERMHMVAERFRKIAASSTIAGSLQGSNSLRDWMFWAVSKKYNVAHIDVCIEESNAVLESDPIALGGLSALPTSESSQKPYADDDWLTTKEVALFLGVSQSTFSRMKARQLIPPHDSLGEGNYKWRFGTIKNL